MTTPRSATLASPRLRDLVLLGLVGLVAIFALARLVRSGRRFH
jgi:hypothetical protein